MPFPEVERVIYANNPLIEVICQVQFPSILKITAEEPTAFQERIRDIYPEYESVGPEGALAQGVPDFLRPLLQSALQDQSAVGGVRQFRFSDPDGVWSVFLSRDALALTSSHYTRWEDFRERLTAICSALVDVYHPTYFSRIGLRYKDLISPEKVSSQDRSWTALLAPHLLGEIGTDEVERLTVLQAVRSIALELEDNLTLALSHGLVEDSERGTQAYLIDADYHKEGQIDTECWTDDLERCHWYAGRVFRWCITDALHEALGPIPVEG